MALKDFFDQLKLIRMIPTRDEFGSIKESYQEIMTFYGGISVLNATNKRAADKEEADTIYQLSTSKYVPLRFGDIIKFENATYRIMTDTNKTPRVANLNMQIFKMHKIKI